MKLTCADLTCQRAPMRTRDGQRWCMWHPDQQAPSVDALSGKLRDENGKPKEPKAKDFLVPASERTTTRPAYRAPGRVVERPTQPGRRAARSAAPDAPADGLCTVDGCRGAWRHRGRHSLTPDGAAAAARYAAGEGLFDLAASLGIGAKRLRALLREQGVDLRKRGQVVGHRGAEPRPIDADQALAMYAAGTNSRDIAKALGVKVTRITALLRERGVLRDASMVAPALADGTPCDVAGCGKPARHRGAHRTGETLQLVSKFTPGEAALVRAHAAALGQTVSAYLRELVRADLVAIDDLHASRDVAGGLS